MASDFIEKLTFALQNTGYGELATKYADDPDQLVLFAAMAFVDDILARESSTKSKRVDWRHKPQKRPRGRPRKKNADTNPVKWYLMVEQIQRIFLEVSAVKITQRQAINYLIEWNQIPLNTLRSSVEKQVITGKKIVMDAAKTSSIE